ncbi:MAG: biotin/lipoyl-binding protein [Anaerovibrio sp.]|uniref:biotin/lipoyl-binding protein n=1 Tax=Anaerovibrio sp. TaxID=1872532 RepID=UPI0025EA844E|nr:biotin/lipoyl-binding protein [Anaerovibrio sp.]MCR5176955.1 biotin/lipoyl-binding protein [Anaerovibrio sp.]
MAEQDKAAQSAEAKWNRGNQQIFSQEALDKMRSPERLDTVLPITTPVAWMGLVAVVVMVFAVLIWSIWGSFTVKADGMGLIMDASGVVKVSANVSGVVDEVYVHSGEKIKKGDPIAHIVQVQAEASTHMAQQVPELAISEKDAASRVHEFDSRLYQQHMTEYIRASHDGIVGEMNVEVGTTVGVGMSICTLRIIDGRRDLTGVLYIPVSHGKRVEPGQTIQLAPNGVDVSQSGSLLGNVRSVSQYPVSLEAVQKKTGNEHLAQWILQSQQSSVMEVNFDLVKDDSDESGLLWTSSVGEHKPVTAGSFCTGSIIIERRPPIEKVFYKLSQWLRNR